MKLITGVLGPPPTEMNGVLSGLVRSYRHLDVDDEQLAHDAYQINVLRSAHLQILSELMDWMRPAVEREREEVVGYLDHVDADVREAG